MGGWWFTYGSGKSQKSSCKCEGSKETSCKIISPEELRKVANDARKKRIEDTMLEVRKDLLSHAAYSGIVPHTIRFKVDLETDILNALAVCGIIVELSTRSEFTLDDFAKANQHSPYAYQRIGTVSYSVSF